MKKCQLCKRPVGNVTFGYYGFNYFKDLLLICPECNESFMNQIGLIVDEIKIINQLGR
jgi:hypothetical protein